MKKRIITGLVLGFILLPLILIHSLFPLLQVVIMLFCIVATLEMLNMVRKKRNLPTLVKVLTVLLTFLIYIGIINEDPACSQSIITQLMNQIEFKVSIITTLTLSVFVLFVCMVFVPNFDASDVACCFMIIFYVALGFSSLTILLFNGMRFIIYLFLICITTDIFALVFGLNFGKHKMAPLISPKKTWEGAIGGTFVGTLLGSLFAIFYENFGHYFVSNGEPIKFFTGVFDVDKFPKFVGGFFIILLSFLISVSSQIGDLVASKFKRTYDIKDFSQIFPGHGGVLDRFDSSLFAGTIFLCVITILRVAMPLMTGISL